MEAPRLQAQLVAQLKVIPVVMSTSSREETDLVKSYRLGVNAYVVKPVGFQQFVEAINLSGMFWAVLNEPPPGSLTGEPVQIPATGS